MKSMPQYQKKIVFSVLIHWRMETYSFVKGSEFFLDFTHFMTINILSVHMYT